MTDTVIDAPGAARASLKASLERHIKAATDAILAEQQPDGHWVYELEADATIPAEYVLMVHYFGETADLELERKIGVYLRGIQSAAQVGREDDVGQVEDRGILPQFRKAEREVRVGRVHVGAALE